MQNAIVTAAVGQSRISRFATLAIVLTPVWLSLAAAAGVI